MRIYLTRLKCLVRNKGNIFWAIFFPLCLGTFFYLGFGRLSLDNILGTIDTYIASDASNNSLIDQMTKIKINDDEFLFNISTKYNKQELENQFNDNKIKGYIYIE